MAEPVRGRPAKRAHGRWDDPETGVLIDAWAPIYRRRRDGEIDPWVPEPRLHRVRADRRLVMEDWRAVASAVNAFRDGARLGSHRTPQQCRGRIETIMGMYGKELYGAAPSSWRFFPVLRDILSPAAAAAAVGLVGQPAGPPTPVDLEQPVPQKAVAAESSSGGDDAEDAGTTMAEQDEDVPDGAVEEEVVHDAQRQGTVVEPVLQQEEGINGGEPAVDVHGPGRGGATGTGWRRSAAFAGQVGVGAAVDAPRIPKKRRTAAGRASGPAGRGGARGRAASAGGVRAASSASAADLCGVAAPAPMNGGSAPVSTVAEVVKKVAADMCQNVAAMCRNMCQDVTRMCQDMVVESLDAERGAARAAGAGRRRP
ncbi:unnamed protein product [Urochloa humidicola]